MLQGERSRVQLAQYSVGEDASERPSSRTPFVSWLAAGKAVATSTHAADAMAIILSLLRELDDHVSMTRTLWSYHAVIRGGAASLSIDLTRNQNAREIDAGAGVAIFILQARICEFLERPALGPLCTRSGWHRVAPRLVNASRPSGNAQLHPLSSPRAPECCDRILPAQRGLGTSNRACGIAALLRLRMPSTGAGCDRTLPAVIPLRCLHKFQEALLLQRLCLNGQCGLHYRAPRRACGTHCHVHRLRKDVAPSRSHRGCSMAGGG